MTKTPKTTAITTRQEPGRLLSAEQFQQLADVPAAMVWLANIDNPNTRRAYQGDIEAFISFCGIEQPDELRQVTRAHVIAWRSDLESQELSRDKMWCCKYPDISPLGCREQRAAHLIYVTYLPVWAS